MNKYKKAARLSLFFRTFCDCREKILSDKKLISKYKKDMAYWCGITRAQVSREFNKWVKFDKLQQELYKKFLVDKQVEELDKKHKRGK